MNVHKRLLPAGTPPPQRPGPPPTTSRQVLRVPRACTSCRRQKMRCDGPDNPPCARCRLSGQQCVFEKVAKPDQLDGSSLERLTEVEGEIAAVKNNQTTMQSTLNEILTELRRSNNRLHDSSVNAKYAPVSNGISEHRSISPQTPVQASGQRHESATLPSLSTIIGSNAANGNRLQRSADSGHHVTFAVSPRPIHHTSRLSGTMTPHRDSGVSSPANSDVDIPAHALLAPIEVINDLAEAPADQSRPSRKRKRTESFGTDNYGPETSVIPDHTGRSAAYGDQSPDVIEKGVITDAEARELYALYFAGCYRILAMFDPNLDTYDSLRRRSPFCFCCLLMVGAKVRDGGGQPSNIQLALENEVTEAVKDTLLRPVKRIEMVQGMLLLAAWSNSTGGTGWIAAGHAVRCAVDLGLDRALRNLSKRVHEGNVGNSETDQNLVRACRTWCALFVFEYQLAFGMRRPAMMGDRAKEDIDLARDILLKHPLSVSTDVRLVSTCQLLCIQYEIHQRLGFDRDEKLKDDYIIAVLHDARTQIDAWQSEWDLVMSVHHGGKGFFRSSAAIQRAYAHLFHNSLAMIHIRTKAQAKAISPEIKSIAFEAVDAAKEALNIVLHNAEYREGLRFAISYTHTCAAFAGGFLLRMARLFPHDFDLDQTCSLVESVAQVLSEVPAKRFSEALYNMLDSLQQRKRASLAAEKISGVPTLEVTVPDSGTSLLSGFTPEGIYSGENHFEGTIPDPLYPSWLTDFRFDGSFLGGFEPHFG
ncbi:hypothetical protein M408DRAFT_327253 [Serendipita vermifera MAFF 305830]|uniref:Zn(2)-C6 fungal-type domain-containing protein n=1 Tax=Serendipita vermifera MAFF 305830 TaxID=933852 RepID=A0A0C3BI89_SERVB|nr:hypothetical protein M408DRAFT_327253 [Serendipita vermifera MAFF 305830]